jgi:hypothetical protein
MPKSALIAGVTGIVGNNLADHLSQKGDWTIYGLARKPPVAVPGIFPIAADLMRRAEFQESLAGIDLTHVFFCTWSRQKTEEENCEVNGQMLGNLLDAVEHSTSSTVTRFAGSGFGRSSLLFLTCKPTIPVAQLRSRGGWRMPDRDGRKSPKGTAWLSTKPTSLRRGGTRMQTWGANWNVLTIWLRAASSAFLIIERLSLPSSISSRGCGVSVSSLESGVHGGFFETHGHRYSSARFALAALGSGETNFCRSFGLSLAPRDL